MKTIVIFRVWRARPRTVLALFPAEDEGHGRCMSYEHVGQHSPADYKFCIQATRPAQPREYADLKQELERIGYELENGHRRPTRK